MLYGALLAIGVSLGVPLAAFGCGLSQGRATASALEAIGRNPEAAGDVRTNLILGLAMIESLVIYALLVFILLQGKLPPVMQVIQQLGQ
ncbi:MAG: ATP synthase F0 subunit C [Armatimonadetes bacterium]|nr:ATP synthase F0 subunit C [Armatimonadota bacterium]